MVSRTSNFFLPGLSFSPLTPEAHGGFVVRVVFEETKGAPRVFLPARAVRELHVQIGNLLLQFRDALFECLSYGTRAASAAGLASVKFPTPPAAGCFIVRGWRHLFPPVNGPTAALAKSLSPCQTRQRWRRRASRRMGASCTGTRGGMLRLGGRSSLLQRRERRHSDSALSSPQSAPCSPLRGIPPSRATCHE